MRGPMVILATLVVLTLLAQGLSQNPGRAAEDPEAGARSAALNAARNELIIGASAQVQAGAERFDLVCAACHGDTGLGYQEGVLSFPSSHQRCDRCHLPSNPDRMADMTVTERNSFHLGNPPALRGDGTLAAFSTGAALHAFIQATMPRHAPGNLEEQAYLDLTVFLLAARGEIPASATLAADELPAVEMHRSR